MANNNNDNKQLKGKKGVNPVVAGVTGAMIGASITTAGIVILKNKKNQEKIKKIIKNAKKQAKEYISELKSKVEDKKDEVISEGKEKIDEVKAKQEIL